MITAEWEQVAVPRRRPVKTVRLCDIDGCGRRHVARGFCRRHWQRWRRLGDPLAGNDLDRPVAPGFAAKPCSQCGGPKPRGIGRKFCDSCAESRAIESAERNALRDREKDLKKKYGITVDEYACILDAQGGGCAICGGQPTKSFRCFDVDHDHETGKVRGLLCRRCNTGLGYIEAGFHEQALAYLERGESVDYR